MKIVTKTTVIYALKRDIVCWKREIFDYKRDKFIKTGTKLLKRDKEPQTIRLIYDKKCKLFWVSQLMLIYLTFGPVIVKRKTTYNKPQCNFHFMLVFYLHFYLDLKKTIYIFIHLQPKYRVVTWLHHLLRLFA